MSGISDDFNLPLSGNMAKRMRTMAPGRNAALVAFDPDHGAADPAAVREPDGIIW